jgi:hypothetical protein
MLHFSVLCQEGAAKNYHCFYFHILSYSNTNHIMAKKVAKVGAKGDTKKAGGKAAGEEVGPVVGT